MQPPVRGVDVVVSSSDGHGGSVFGSAKRGIAERDRDRAGPASVLATARLGSRFERSNASRGNPLPLRHGGRRLGPRKGHRIRLDRPPPRRSRLPGPAAEVRPLHQRRPGDDEPVPARRGLRHRGRRRDRPRPRPLRALHRPQHLAGLERLRRLRLQHGHRPRAPRRLPRRDRPGDPAHHRRDQAEDPDRRRGAVGRLRDHRDRRHRRRHRVAAVPRGDPPALHRPRPEAGDVPAPDARSLRRPRRRAEDEADPALGQRAAPDRDPAARRPLPLRVRARPRHPPQDRPVRLAARGGRDLRPRRRQHLQGAARLPRRGHGRPDPRPLRDRRPAAGPDRLGGVLPSRRRRRGHGPDRARRQVRAARGRLQVGDRVAQARRLAPRRQRRGRPRQQRGARRRRSSPRPTGS